MREEKFLKIKVIIQPPLCNELNAKTERRRVFHEYVFF
jgi:hypothetical protein